MNAFKATRPRGGKSNQSNFDVAFEGLCNEIETPMFCKPQGFLLTQLRKKYESLLQTQGENIASRVQCTKMENIIILQKYGKRVPFIDQSVGTGFVCASSVLLRDIVQALHKLEGQSNEERHLKILKRAGKIIEMTWRH